MMVAFPGATPVTTPVVEPTVATDVALLLQVPPAILLLRLMVAATHTVEAPLMVPAVGTGLTVTVADAVADPQVGVVTV